MELDLARAREEASQLKQQLAEAQAIEKERRKLADKVDKLETKVSAQSWHCQKSSPISGSQDSAFGCHQMG